MIKKFLTLFFKCVNLDLQEKRNAELLDAR